MAWKKASFKRLEKTGWPSRETMTTVGATGAAALASMSIIMERKKRKRSEREIDIEL